MYDFDRHNEYGIQQQALTQMTLAEVDVCMDKWTIANFVRAAKNEGHTEEQALQFIRDTYADGYVLAEKYETRKKRWGAIALIVLVVVWVAFMFAMVEPQ